MDINILKNKIKYYGLKENPCKINKNELKKGINIELEHTDDKKIAKAISLAHLCEFPNYYSKGLIPMEKKLKLIKGRL